MQIDNLPFGTTDWSTIEKTEHQGDTGVAYWQTQNFADMRAHRSSTATGAKLFVVD
jgi:hypothetical protein